MNCEDRRTFDENNYIHWDWKAWKVKEKWQTKAWVEVEGRAFKTVEEIITYLESVE